MTYKECFLAEQLTRTGGLHVPLLPLRILLLQESHLIAVERQGPLTDVPLQREPPVIAAAQCPLVPDLLHRGRADAHALKPEPVARSVAAPRRVLRCNLHHPRHHGPGRGYRMTLGNRRQVLQPLQAVGLKAPLVLAKARARDAAASPRLRHPPQRLGQLQQAQPLLRQFLLRRHRCLLRTRVTRRILPAHLLRKKLEGTLNRTLTPIAATLGRRPGSGSDPVDWAGAPPPKHEARDLHSDPGSGHHSNRQ